MNIRGVKVRAAKSPTGFAGQKLYQSISLKRDEAPVGKFHFRYWQDTQYVSQEYENNNEIKLGISFATRGIYTLPRITISNFYPLGLFHCWSHLAFPQQVLIYPTPKPSSLPTNSRLLHKNDSGSQLGYASGTDEYYSLEKHQPGQPLHHIDWKQVAKGRGLLTKHFVSYQQQALWLSLSPALGTDLEVQLQKLCFLILELSQKNLEFGLDLGHCKQHLATGEEHKENCLKALAVYPRMIDK